MFQFKNKINIIIRISFDKQLFIVRYLQFHINLYFTIYLIYEQN